MPDISCDILIVGAGVLGLCVATELSARGRDVCVVDPGEPNASTVAAGMIAPAFESVLDGADRTRAALLAEAATLWPEAARRIGVMLDTTPAEWRGPDSAGVAARLKSLNFPVQWADGRLRVAGDFRIDPEQALAAMIEALGHRLVITGAIACEPLATGWRVRTSLGAVDAGHLVIATGTGEALRGLPEIVVALINGIEPIAGQIGRCPQTRVPDGVFRGPDGYVAAGDGALTIGATMVSGSRDVTPDAGKSLRLVAAAERLLGETLKAPVTWRGGVRGGTPDGLPLAGPTGLPDLSLALAPRRNGWLLGPLVARIVADGIEGGPRTANGAAFAPWRFESRLDPPRPAVNRD